MLTPEEIAMMPITIDSYGPDVARAKKYVYLSGAAYCFDIPAWTCPYCKKSQSFGYEFHSQIVNKEANTLAFIAVNKDLKEIVVSYRGTLNMQNLVQDTHPSIVSIEAGSTSLERGKKSKGPEIWVHTGMINATNSLYPEVVEKLGKLLKKHPDFDVVVIGLARLLPQPRRGCSVAHSFLLKEELGLPKDFPTPKSYSYFGYGTPRVGNQAYADYWNAQPMQITRVINKADFAAYTPSALGGYVHNGNELWIMLTGGEKVCSKMVYEDLSCANSLAALSNVHDHLHYWDVHFLSCAGADPVATAKQFVIDMPSE
ncbi:lipase [Folsomia candida]|uniref:lipase n=1 Tax=Folsomia candida TaxID=158441 RepID=UPI000B8F63F5|nr:lipase [Folsomia candida]